MRMKAAQSEQAYEGVYKHHAEKLKHYFRGSRSETSEHLKII